MPGISFNEEIQKTSEEINEKYLKEKKTQFYQLFDNYLEPIKKLEFENPPSLLVNKYSKYKNLSNEEMQGEELKLISKIPNIDKYPNINKGIQELIENLIKIQKD